MSSVIWNDSSSQENHECVTLPAEAAKCALVKTTGNLSSPLTPQSQAKQTPAPVCEVEETQILPKKLIPGSPIEKTPIPFKRPLPVSPAVSNAPTYLLPNKKTLAKQASTIVCGGFVAIFITSSFSLIYFLCQQSLSTSTVTPIHPMTLPYISSSQECERRDKIWQDGECLDYDVDSQFPEPVSNSRELSEKVKH